MITGNTKINELVLPYEAANISGSVITVDKAGIFYSGGYHTLGSIGCSSPAQNQIVVIHCSSSNTINFITGGNLIFITTSIATRRSIMFQFNGVINYWVEIGTTLGTNGAQGSQGATGESGSTGSAGAGGVPGFQGAFGVSAQGNQGAQGAPGASGSQGGIGPTGPQGAEGAQGAQGAQG